MSRKFSVLTIRIGAALSLLLGFLAASHLLIERAIDKKEHESIVLNTAGRQRTRIHWYASEVNHTLVAQATGRWSRVLEHKNRADELMRLMRTEHGALIDGGRVDDAITQGTKVRIPPTTDPVIREELEAFVAFFDRLEISAVRALRSTPDQLSEHDDVIALQSNALRAEGEMDRIATLMQHESERKLRQLSHYHLLGSAGAAALVILILLWIHYRIIAPFEKSIADLEVAKRQSEEATRSKSEFLANMSHEIRTPMTAILGFAEALGDSVNTPDTLDAVATIQRNGRHLLSIINDILDLSKIEAGRMTVERVHCSPAEVVGDVEALMRDRAHHKGLDLIVEYPTPIPAMIESDPTRIKQILVNLIGNALKFTETGDARLVVSYNDDGYDPRIVFEVIDTGIGMTEDHMDRLFQPFMQADSSTTRMYGGTGLGMTISKKLAELLGGSLTAESAIGEGSRFRLSLPTGWPEDPSLLSLSEEYTRGSSPVNSSKSRETLPCCRILLAEDGLDNQRLITHFLTKAGAEVEIVADGEAAVDAVANDPTFELVIMDMQMPMMDGYEATRRIRESGSRIPIIALTAHAMSGDRQKCLQAGCTDYVTKPVDRTALIRTINERIEPCTCEDQPVGAGSPGAAE